MKIKIKIKNTYVCPMAWPGRHIARPGRPMADLWPGRLSWMNYRHQADVSHAYQTLSVCRDVCMCVCMSIYINKK